MPSPAAAKIRPDGTETLIAIYARPRARREWSPARVVHAVLSCSSGQPWKYTFYDVLDREIGSMTPHFSGQLLIAQKIYNNLGQMRISLGPLLPRRLRPLYHEPVRPHGARKFSKSPPATG